VVKKGVSKSPEQRTVKLLQAVCLKREDAALADNIPMFPLKAVDVAWSRRGRKSASELRKVASKNATNVTVWPLPPGSVEEAKLNP